MSRVAKNPVAIPAGAEVSIDASNIVVKGPLGTLTQPLHPSVRSSDGRSWCSCRH